MSRAVVLSMVLSLFATLSHSQVSYQGLVKEDLNFINAEYPDATTTTVNLSVVDEMVRRLTLRNNYSTVKAVESEKGQYTIIGEPLKIIKQMKVTGYRSLGEIDILNAIGLKEGQRYDTYRAMASARRLKELYGLKGFFNASIEFSSTDISDEEVLLEFKITENNPCRITEIIFETDNEELKSRLQRRVRRILNRNFTEDNMLAIESRVNTYFQDERYLQAQIQQKEAIYNSDQTQATLVYEIKNPYRFEVRFDGNERYSRADLLRALRLSEFDRGSVNPSLEITQIVRSHYIKNGYAHANVTYKDRIVEDRNTKEVSLKIKEGPQVRIRKIDVVGRISRPAQYYANFILKNSSTAVEKRLYVRDDLDRGHRNLTIELNNQGFLRARVQSVRTELSEDQSQIDVMVILDEGPLTQIRRITFEGANSFKETELLSVLGLENNAPLRLYQLEDGIDKLKDFYINQAFLEMRIENEDSNLVTYDERGAQASLHFEIHEGPQITVRDVIVEGNSFTSDYVVLKEANVRGGQLLTPQVIREAEGRLERLGIFTRAEISTLEAGSRISNRTVVISITERNPGTFRMGVGLTNRRDLTARGYTGVSYNNLFGTARAVSLRGSVENNLVRDNFLEYNVTAGYMEPFFLGNRVRGRFSVAREEKVITFDDSVGEENVVIQATNRFSFNLERELTPEVRFTWTAYSHERVDQFQKPFIDFERDKQQIATIGPTLEMDYRDNPFLPTRGTFSRFDAEYSAPDLGSSELIEFVRTQANFTHYQRLGSPRFVWANSLRGGYGKNLSSKDSSGIPVSYAFFLGGPTTIRGFSGSLRDRTPSSDEFETKRGQLVIPDYTTYYLLKSEIRYPIYGILGGVIFYDAGEVHVSGFSFDKPFKQSIGIGLRLNTPIGPITLDYGRKINPKKDPKEATGQVHLSVGTF